MQQSLKTVFCISKVIVKVHSLEKETKTIERTITTKKKEIFTQVNYFVIFSNTHDI